MPSAIVIGAGPAGSVAATILARAGWEITIIEQHRFPRDKVCGECVSAMGISCLKRLGLLTAIENLGATPLRRTILHSADSASATLDLSRPMLGISRRAMDTALLEAACNSGATALQPARFEGFGDGAVRIRDLTDNSVRSFRADQVIIADGKAPKQRFRDFGIKAHFEKLDGPPHAIELFGCRGFYGGIAPIENGVWNLAFSVPGKLLNQFKGDIDAMFDAIREKNPALDGRLSGGIRVSRWLSAPLPRFAPSNVVQQSNIRVGNAAAALEPIGGEGMGLAMCSAALAATALLENRLDLLESQYNSLWRVRRLACQFAGIVVSRPLLLKPSMLLLRKPSPVSRLSLALIGK